MLIDMDYFFVACEELRRPEIKDKPTIVGFDPKQGEGRGVVMTCNYLARKFGIRSGMPISTAYRIKPDAVYLPIDYDYYEKMSREVMGVAKRYADRFEQVSIDEAYIELSRKSIDYDSAVEYAKKIKESINKETGLPCTIGVSSNKLLAKMACEAGKPDGIKLVKEEEAKEFLKGKDLDDLYGIGRKTKEKLEAMGYKAVGDLAKANTMELMEKFGSYGVEMQKSANGIDESKVEENYEVKSIGREKTFERDTTERTVALAAIRELSNEVIKEVQKAELSFKVVTVKMRYADFTEHLKSRSIRRSDQYDDLASTATDLYSKYASRVKRIRKMGVRVSDLGKEKGQKKINSFV